MIGRYRSFQGSNEGQLGAKAKFAMLNPSNGIADWILQVVPEIKAGCPPGMLGIGIGGTAEKPCRWPKKL